MLTKILFLTLFVFYAVSANNEDGTFAMKFEKCEVGNYNHDWIKDLDIKCTMVNETHFKVDGSGTLLKEMNFDLVMATGQIYIYEKDQYVIKPQLKMTLSSCEEYTKGIFGHWKEIENHGNIKGCGKHAPGLYSVKDYVPRMKIKEVSIPKEARIKLSVKLDYEKEEIMDILFFVAIAPK